MIFVEPQRSATGLLLVGHGTRDITGTDQFFELAKILQHRVAPVVVQPCLLELQSPTIEEGWRNLVESGVTHVHIAPLLLFSAGHAKRDIPDAIAGVAAESPQVTYDFCRPLSRHRAIVELAAERIGSQLSRLPDDRSTALVMVGRGSYDPCARSDMLVLSEVVGRRLAKKIDAEKSLYLNTCFYAMADPRLPDVLDAVCNVPGIRNVVVYPHLLFEGRLYQAIRRHVAEVATRYPTHHLAICDYLGPDPQLAEAIWDRSVNSLLSA